MSIVVALYPVMLDVCGMPKYLVNIMLGYCSMLPCRMDESLFATARLHPTLFTHASRGKLPEKRIFNEHLLPYIQVGQRGYGYVYGSSKNQVNVVVLNIQPLSKFRHAIQIGFFKQEDRCDLATHFPQPSVYKPMCTCDTASDEPAFHTSGCQYRIRQLKLPRPPPPELVHHRFNVVVSTYRTTSACGYNHQNNQITVVVESKSPKNFRLVLTNHEPQPTSMTPTQLERLFTQPQRPPNHQDSNTVIWTL